MKKGSKVVFINDKLEETFYNLDNEDFIKKSMIRAIKNLKVNAFSGIQIPKRLIPSEYINKYKIKNLWKLDLVNGWRLLYTVTADGEVEIITAILDWFSHKEYDRKMKY